MPHGGQTHVDLPAISLVIGTLTSYVTLLAGAVINRILALKSLREARTLALHREFTSGAMSKARSQAYHLLITESSRSLAELAELHNENELVNPLLDLIFFYSHLSLTVRYKQVERRMVPELFGKVFFWWYFSFFKVRGLETSGFEVTGDIVWLREWLESHATKAEIQEWMQNARPSRG